MDDHRPFQAVNVGMTSVETGRERFTKDEIYTPPPMSYWRCNLSALSQRFNLYFIASGDGIAVYQPQFPFQKLKRTPQLFIPLDVANPQAAGFIDRSQPHAANHVIVGDLGREEILLAATDSGNVVAYHTKAINDAIKKDPYRFSTNARSDYVGVRAFFSHWVNESAWGLAIHREGRMIAVSANVPHNVQDDDPSAKITVFAFALSERDNESSDIEDAPELESEDPNTDWYDWNPDLANGSTPNRDRNFKITLGGYDGHKNNIPSVAFVNTREDLQGTWLLSTDIQAEMKVWQIWRGACHTSSDFADRSSVAAVWNRRRECGWLVAALDPLSFCPTTSMEQFCGHSKPQQYYGHVGESYDISNAVRLRIPGNSPAHPLLHETSDEEDDSEEAERGMDCWSEEEEEEDDEKGDPVAISRGQSTQQTLSSSKNSLHPNDSERSLRLTGSSPPRPRPLDETRSEHTPRQLSLQMILPAAEDQAMDDVVERSDESSDDEFVGEWPQEDQDGDINDPSESEGQEPPFSPISYGSATSASSLPNRNSEDMEEERVFLSRPSVLSGAWEAYTKKVPSQYAQQLRRARAEQELRKNGRIPFIPTLHCSNSHLRIVNAPQATTPHIYCSHLLKQILPPGLELGNHAHFERLNMLQQIPELGIVVIANQSGRCAVCTLTKKGKSGILGIRVDWTLPTKRQERAGMRPFGPLLGIAVAPIQGRTVRQPDLSSEHDRGEDWARDRVLDGVLTTFDPKVLVLNRKDAVSDSSDGEAQGKSKRGRTSQDWTSLRKQRSDSSQYSESSHASTEQRPWKKPERVEAWRAVENSRRYRLMMTYSDMTVLTYELSRGIERDDVAENSFSTLEQMD